MSANFDGVLQAAIELSEPEQIILVARLLEALPPDSRALFMDVIDVDDESCTKASPPAVEVEAVQNEPTTEETADYTPAREIKLPDRTS